jgi:hypothetical protein
VTVALDLGAYSDIADYPGLIDKVRLWLDRGDELNPYLPTFIMLAESYLNRTLRTPEMEAYTSVPVVGGLARLPLDCLEVRGISVGERPLQATSPANLARDYRGLAGAPLSYAIRGRDLLLAPTSDDALDLTYWQRIPALTLNAPVNWLLDGHPDIYLYGSLAAASGYIDDPEKLGQWQAAFEGAVEQLRDAGNRARWGGPIVARSGVQQFRRVRA